MIRDKVDEKWQKRKEPYLFSFFGVDSKEQVEALNGKKLKTFPTNVDQLTIVTPVYETLDGWNTDITNCENYDDLPAKTRDYLDFISRESGIKIDIVSVGPKRKQTFYVE